MSSQFTSSTAAITPSFRLPGWPRRRSQSGWVGVDIGTACTKLAQVERHGSGYRISARWIVPGSAEPSPIPEQFLEDAFGQRVPHVRHARSMFRGRQAAAVLPCGVTELRCLEVPRGSRDEMRLMIRNELHADATADTGAEPCFDFWETPATGGSPENMAQVAVMQVRHDAARRLAAGLNAAGLDCQILDGLPCVLARAAQLAIPTPSDSPIAVLDLGYASALLVVAMGGRPLMTRLLRGCGLRALMQPLAAGLNVSADVCHQLLRRYGISLAPHASDADTRARATYELVAQPLDCLTTEIKRTLDYWETRFRSRMPHQMLMMGGGSLVRNLPEYLTAETDLSTCLWKMAAEHGSTGQADDSLFAAAAALSALAWETAPCT